MTTTANELGEREETGKQDKETEGKTDWTWICICNDFLFFISDLFRFHYFNLLAKIGFFAINLEKLEYL
jgi:hypothetical protein